VATSDLSNDAIKHTLKSRETIPLINKMLRLQKLILPTQNRIKLKAVKVKEQASKQCCTAHQKGFFGQSFYPLQ
jgi:hypothetical protein